MAQMGGAVSFLWEVCSKNTGLQGSTLSGPRMTTGFGPFELPTRGLLQKGRDHSLPKFCRTAVPTVVKTESELVYEPNMCPHPPHTFEGLQS